jgi:hypothetical protein
MHRDADDDSQQHHHADADRDFLPGFHGLAMVQVRLRRHSPVEHSYTCCLGTFLQKGKFHVKDCRELLGESKR